MKDSSSGKFQMKSRLPSFADLQFQRCCFSFMIDKDMEKEEYSKICHAVVQRLMEMNDIEMVTVDHLIRFVSCKRKNGFFCYLIHYNEFNEEQYVLMSDAYSGNIERFLIDFAIENHTDVVFYLYGRKITLIPKAKSLEELLVWLDLNAKDPV